MPSRQLKPSVPLLLALVLAISGIFSAIFTPRKANAQVVVAVTGTVEWKPQGGRTFHPVSPDMSLRQGSLLRLERRASVTISCPNGQPEDWTVPGVSGLNQICPSRTTSGRTITPRTGIRDIPYAILPRATAIFSKQPILRWNAPIGADRFTLTVRGRGLNWTIPVEGVDVCQDQTCEFVYPGTPELQPGTSYRFVIETNNGRSSAEETTPRLGFELLEETKASEVNQGIESIEAQNLSDPLETLALANVYTFYNLISDAILILEDVPQSDKTVEVHRQLGDLYRQIGLTLEAEVQYLEAIAIATDHPFELAAAQAGLGEVSYSLGRRDEAVQLLQTAKAEYEQLGDVEQVAELEERLLDIQL